MAPKRASTTGKKQTTLQPRIGKQRVKRVTKVDDEHLRASFLQQPDAKKKKLDAAEQRRLARIHSTIDPEKKRLDDMLAEPVAKREIEVHQETMDETDKKLRAFDLSYAYGPCVGLSRMERWERAQTLGLNPPEEIKTLLMATTARKSQAECLFYGTDVI
ncbi:DNA polymerase delta, subunit 4-domain-containing protein [Gongronella butleri]|nr:DNA polymerase delta, subunit 4-domain-containing protein [Gongronella butleri]